ncbi:MAG: shikimate kinase [Acidimicrobiia bacterium]|jgi:shikimate kinase|nr:shikimate kinase [Acidimicrobiia bacterium]MBP8180116.1 shikimate kinase [Acidimicrobiia bacterium]
MGSHRSPTENPRHLVLVGMMGAGKSTIGHLAANNLGMDFNDIDEMIVRRERLTIPQIIDQRGEQRFRALERDIVALVTDREPSVISTGGGTPVDPVSRHLLRMNGVVVWLDVPLDQLVARVGDGHNRPLLQTGRPIASILGDLLEKRRPIYQAAAHHVVTTPNGSISHMLTDVLAAYRQGPTESKA